MKIEFDEVCKSCKGTGLYIGMAERDGSAIICSTCTGTGCNNVIHEYEPFRERIKNTKVKRVFQTNVGIVIGENKDLVLSDFGGMSYDNWDRGNVFLPGMEMRKYACPCWWYQTVDYTKKPNWKECNSSLGSTFSKCACFQSKVLCWKKWDKEFGENTTL